MTGEGSGDDGGVPRVRQDATVSELGVAVQAGRDVRDVRIAVHQTGQVRVTWPVRVGIPPTPAQHYQQRRQVQAVLVETLTEGRAAVLVGARQRAGVVVSGLGGVGKTQLAAQYAWSVWSDPDLDVAVWVSALSRDAVVTAYAEAAARVLVERDPGIGERPPERAAGLFREWLAGTSRRWLVVLDDVQDPAALKGLDPPAVPSGRVVITSRLRDAALTQGGHRVIELDVFTPDQAVAYLAEALTGTTDGTDRDQLEGLAAELGWLPLALGQAAAYLTDQPLLGVADYRAMLADRRRTLAELTPPEHALPDHQLTVAATWSLSIEHADRADDTRSPTTSRWRGLLTRVRRTTGSRGGGLVRPLLEIAALLDPNGTPLAVFTARPVLDHLTTRTGREVTATDVHHGLTRLHRFSLITLTPDRPARTVAVHALVQRAVRDTLTPDRLHTLAHTTADALHTVWPENDTTNPDLEQALRSGTDTLHTHTTPMLLTPALHLVFVRAGNSLGKTGQVYAATTYWHALHYQACTHLGSDHSDTLATRHSLAFSRGRAGDPAGAMAALEMLLADRLRVLGPDHPDTLATRHSLASWRGRAGDPAGAMAALETVLADRLRVLGPDHPDTLATRHNLAFSRGKAGDPAGAMAALEMLLADRLRVLGPDHPHTLTARHSLASWRGRAGDPAGAMAALEMLLADRLRVLGPDHPDTLATRHSLACWRGRAGDPAGAMAALETVLADRLRVLGPDHPDTLATRHNLARWRGKAEQQSPGIEV
ncbi:tetratricopeptide repeat protein [Saccharothrix syringae]|uniref:Tetratricopeptide repeat protein n=1 Tax=Saccharothrix syringae TaxID=103733 RepID=A0A5Q0H2H6_SACSY|nr:tetratricopeptide repeat protein [Saccharothrix syringae]QFZ20457.1 tetratricopeptide repeat protein [Saccharothrix syringae]